MGAETKTAPEAVAHRARVPIVLASIGTLVLALGGLLLWRANAAVNPIALGSSRRPVTTITARSTTYRPTLSYVGSFEAWVEANIGPQYLSAYVTSVRVRPGAVVRRNDVVATLDCQTANAATQAIASQANAIQARERALADEATRMGRLLDGGFVSVNEVETKDADSAAERATFLSTRSKLLGSNLAAQDCVMRAPFDGEIATRSVDPGGYVHPGESVVSIVDRSVVRFVADAPEKDFDALAPGTPVTIHVLATGKDVAGKVSRRAPKADPATRTVHLEVDLDDGARDIPVATTGVVELAVGEPKPASAVPLSAVNVSEQTGRLLVVEQGVAHAKTAKVLGEAKGLIYLEPGLANAEVVVEGRAQVKDGDRVAAKAEAFPGAAPPSKTTRGAGYARPL